MAEKDVKKGTGEQADSIEDTKGTVEVPKESAAVRAAKKKAAAMIAEAERADKEQAELTKAFKGSKAVVFISKYKNHCFTMLPIVIKKNDLGVSEKIHPGKDIQFNNGVYSTSDEAEIKFLKAKPGFGSIIRIATSTPSDVKAAVKAQIG